MFSNNKSDRKISNIEESQFNISTQYNTDMSSLLTLPIIVGVSFLSFVLGYCSGWYFMNTILIIISIFM